jgi:hypothetical protein
MEGRVNLKGRVEAFGFTTTEAEIDAIARPASWRATRALLAAGIGLGAAPVVAIVPPHIPWALGSLIGGAVIARKRATEHFTLRTLAATCPRCGEPLTTEAGRLADTRSLHCDKCGLDSILHVERSDGGSGGGGA